jgi:hypothetical protein
VIEQGYLDIEYDYRLPLLVFTDRGWDIERETMADELLQEFRRRPRRRPARSRHDPPQRSQSLIDLPPARQARSLGQPSIHSATPGLAKVDYKKVRNGIERVIRQVLAAEQ